MRETAEFDNIFRLYYEHLYNYAHQYLPDPDDCHDIVTAAYEDVWRNFDRVKTDTVRDYLFTCVRNKCIDQLRRRKSHDGYIEFVRLMSSPHEDSSALEHDDQLHTMRLLLDSLKSPTREILEACYLYEKKYQEVADEMHISVSTVKKHMVRALRTIREFKKKLKT